MFITESHRGLSCSGDQATAGQVVHITLKYIKDHPELEHLPAGQLAYSALTGAFGCKGQFRRLFRISVHTPFRSLDAESRNYNRLIFNPAEG